MLHRQQYRYNKQYLFAQVTLQKTLNHYWFNILCFSCYVR